MNFPQEATLFVTEWVTNRGILKVKGTRADYSWQRVKKLAYYNIDIRGYRQSLVVVGKNAFFTLEEAQADAQRRFRERVEKATKELKVAKERLRFQEAGKLQVHSGFEDISKLRPFKDS